MMIMMNVTSVITENETKILKKKILIYTASSLCSGIVRDSSDISDLCDISVMKANLDKYRQT